MSDNDVERRVMKTIGLMGAGVVARYGHLPAIAATPGLRLSAIFEPDVSAHAELSAQYPTAKIFADSEAFFTSGIDSVTITSPAPAHLQNVLGAVRHRKPILCEKPLAMDELEIEQMIAATKAANVPLFTAFCYRFSPASLMIKKWIDEKAIGTLRAMRLLYLWNLHGRFETLPDGKIVPHRRRIGRMLEGGPMVDCGAHQIDLAQFWTGSPIIKCQSHGVWVEDFEAPDHMVLHMDHANAVHTMVEISYSFTANARDPYDEFTYHLIGTDGLIRYERHTKTFELRTPNRTERFEWYPEKNFKGMYQHFADFLHTGNPGALPTAEEGLITTRIARTATEQAIAGRPVPSPGTPGEG
jgi:predicted dehydrogenase